MRDPRPELPVIQRIYDFTLWLVPILNRWPRDHKFALGDRMVSGAYDLLEGLVGCRYLKDKERRLAAMNGLLDRLRYQIRLAHDLHLFDAKRYAFAAQSLDGIGNELGGWIKQQARKAPSGEGRQP